MESARPVRSPRSSRTLRGCTRSVAGSSHFSSCADPVSSPVPSLARLLALVASCSVCCSSVPAPSAICSVRTAVTLGSVVTVSLVVPLVVSVAVRFSVVVIAGAP